MEEFTIREATAADKDDVLRIRDDVYGGLDYLPGYYDHFIGLPNATSFVLLHNSKVVGFNTNLLVDNGETIISKASRICKDYEGKGVYKFLDTYKSAWAKSKGVRYKRITMSDTNPHSIRRSFRSKNKLMETMFHFVYLLKTEQLALQDSDFLLGGEVSHVLFDHVTDYFRDRDIASYLFPHDCIVVDYFPYKAMESNIPKMKAINNHTDVFSDVRFEQGTVRGALSFGTVFKTQKVSYEYNIEIYGHDKVSIKKHTLRHIMNLRQKVKGSVCMFILTQGQFSSETTDGIFQKYEIGRINTCNINTCNIEYSEWQFKQEFVFEKNL